MCIYTYIYIYSIRFAKPGGPVEGFPGLLHMVLMIYVFVFLQLPGFAFICRFWCSFVSPQFPSFFNFERKLFERLGIWFAATVSLRWPCWRPSGFHVWWLSWCIAPFCHECGLPLVFIFWSWCHFVSFGIHLGFIWLHLDVIGPPNGAPKRFGD